MATQGGRLRIEVYVGSGQPPSMEVAPGQVFGPLSIGTSGDWKLQAQGVSPVHGYVYSNGAELFLRSESAGQPILANGEPVPTDQWMPARAPCEIKIGVARLWFGEAVAAGAEPGEETKKAPPAAEEPIAEDSTVDRGGPPSMTEILQMPLDGGPTLKFDPAQRPQVPSGPRPAAGAPPYSTPRPAAGMPPQIGPPPPEVEDLGPPKPTEEGATRTIPIEQLLAMQAAKQSRPQGADPSNPGGIPGFPMGGPGGGPGSSPGFGAPPGAMGSSPGFGAPPGAPGSMPGFGAPPGAPGSMPGFGAPGSMPGFGAPPGYAGAPGAGGPGGAPGGAALPGWRGVLAEKTAWVKARWKEATPVQRILVVLMLPLLIAVWTIFSDDPPPPKRAPSKPAASATAAATAGSSADPPGSAAPAGSASPDADAGDAGDPDGGAQAPTGTADPSTPATAASVPAEAPLPPGKKTLQRQAVDAVAAGSYAEAAKLYEELAQANPDVPAYAEAARIMRAKAAKP